MRHVVFWLAAAFLACWCAVGLVVVAETLATDCARAASEISDPCAFGRFTYLAFGFAFWAVFASPLVAVCWLTRPRRS